MGRIRTRVLLLAQSRTSIGRGFVSCGCLSTRLVEVAGDAQDLEVGVAVVECVRPGRFVIGVEGRGEERATERARPRLLRGELKPALGQHRGAWWGVRLQ